jgi:two-component system osmolarity sensor histidine kinase EnvZ
MSFAWLKRYVPRGLYGRAALILILPVVLLQLLVSVVFIQRHFEGVTEQMTRSVVQELRLIQRTVDPAEQAALARALNYELAPGDTPPAADTRRWFDLSGIVVIRELEALLSGVRAIALPDDDDARIWLATAAGPRQITFDRTRVSASNPHQLLVNMVFFGALMTVIAFLYLRNQLRPITRLAEAAEAFGRGHALPYRPGGAVEVRAAGRAFLDMRARLERQMEQRTLMLSGVSHDLRTPLTRLKLGLSMSDDPDAEAMARDVLEMERMIDEFLDFARSDSAGLPPEMVDPAALLGQIVEDARRAGQDVTLARCDAVGEMPLRPVALRRALENLIGNATRYGSRAELRMEAAPAALRIVVEDDGPGIARADREAALRPFMRLDAARNQDRGSGVGLGLSIAMDIARAHGGRLDLEESASLGGLSAVLVLPR